MGQLMAWLFDNWMMVTGALIVFVLAMEGLAALLGSPRERYRPPDDPHRPRYDSYGLPRDLYGPPDHRYGPPDDR